MSAWKISGQYMESCNCDYLDNTAHPANTRLALARTQSLNVEGFGLSLAMTGKGNNGHFAPFSWAN